MRDILFVIVILGFISALTIGYVMKKEEAENLKLKLVFCETNKKGDSPF